MRGRRPADSEMITAVQFAPTYFCSMDSVFCIAVLAPLISNLSFYRRELRNKQTKKKRSDVNVGADEGHQLTQTIGTQLMARLLKKKKVMKTCPLCLTEYFGCIKCTKLFHSIGHWKESAQIATGGWDEGEIGKKPWADNGHSTWMSSNRSLLWLLIASLCLLSTEVSFGGAVGRQQQQLWATFSSGLTAYTVHTMRLLSQWTVAVDCPDNILHTNTCSQLHPSPVREVVNEWDRNRVKNNHFCLRC